MPKAPKEGSSRKPPEPSDSHAEIADWMKRVMPDLQPLVKWVDKAIREDLGGVHYALKWKKAYYGLPDKGWVIELVAYDVSVNVVFLGGSDFSSPPPQGSGKSRYIKLKSLDEAKESDLVAWIKEAAKHPGWQ